MKWTSLPLAGAIAALGSRHLLDLAGLLDPARSTPPSCNGPAWEQFVEILKRCEDLAFEQHDVVRFRAVHVDRLSRSADH